MHKLFLKREMIFKKKKKKKTSCNRLNATEKVNSKYNEILKSTIGFVMACFLSNHGTHACIINLLSNTGNEAAEVCLIESIAFCWGFVLINTAGKYGEIKDNSVYLLIIWWIKASFCGRCNLFWRPNGGDFVISGGRKAPEAGEVQGGFREQWPGSEGDV